MENIIFVEDHEATLEIRVGKECFFCTGNHPLKKYEAFKKQSVDGRWQTVKRFGLCFRCLADNHHGKSCPLSKQCSINRCKVNNSLKFDGQHYEVAVPWRDERPQLPNNLPMAKKRLVSTERKLMKDKEIAMAYQQVLNNYLNKKDICHIPDEEPMPECQWLLPHFPVVRPEKATSKVRLVFDGSVPFEGKSLNTEALTGLKLQSDIFDILVKFRKEWVALIVDISQMYHQLVLFPEDRPMHRFLWRNMQITKEPKVYEFLCFVFGGCYCSFCAQFT